MFDYRITPRPATPDQLEWLADLLREAGETSTPLLTYMTAAREIERLHNLLSGVTPPAELQAHL